MHFRSLNVTSSFWHLRNIGKTLLLKVFSEQWHCSTCSFSYHIRRNPWTRNFFGIFGRIKALFCDEKSFKFFVYLFYPKNSTINSRKTSIIREWLIVESSPTPFWVAFLMLSWLVYNIPSHFHQLILVWSVWCYLAFFKSQKIWPESSFFNPWNCMQKMIIFLEFRKDK